MDSKELRGLYEAYQDVYQLDELHKGKHGQSETEYMDSRSDAGKQISGDSTHSGASYSHRSYRGVGTPAKPGERQKNQGKMTPADRNELEYRKAKLKKEELDIFDMVLEYLYVEGYAETLEDAGWLMSNLIDEEAIGIIAELTGGKGHPGYKAGSKDLGPMDAGHPADSEKRKDKGGTMSMRHGYHLGDIDDKDDDDDGLETIVKQQSRDSREGVRKPLRDKVRSARKVLSKEDFEIWLDEAMSSYDKNRKRAAARAEERNRQREAGTLGGRMERISLRDKFGDAAGTRMAKAKPPGPGEKY